MKKNHQFILKVITCIVAFASICSIALSQKNKDASIKDTNTYSKRKVIHGKASYYANKFEGRKTASGEVFRQSKKTEACNRLPLGTWVLITNLTNHTSAKVKINDRLHVKNKRLIDVTSSVAKKLDFYKKGLANVKIEVVQKK